MSEIVRMPVIVAINMIQPFCTYFDRVSHWHPLAAMGRPFGVFFVLKALLPLWVYLSIVYTLTAASIVVFGGMFLAWRASLRRDGGPGGE